ncbi:TOBE domain-containing protein [Nocardioides montaniterrae]
MTTYRISETSDLLGVSPDTVRRWVEAGRLSAHTVDGRTSIPGPDLAAFAASLIDSGERERIGGTGISARNRMRGLVTKVTKDKVMAQIEMVCGPYRIVSLMSAEAATELGLEPGALAVASIKSTNVVVERPAR